MTHLIGWLKQKDVRIWLALAAVLAVLWVQWPRLFDPFQVDEDFRSFYWMNKFQDPALYTDEPSGSGEYAYSTLHLPWGNLLLYMYSPGFGLLYYLLSFVASPVFCSKFLALILLPLSAICLFEWGQAVRGRAAGLTLAVSFILLNLASPTSLSVLSGLQRAFSLPLLIGLMYSLRHRRYLWAGVIGVLTALIYVPILFLALGAWGLDTLRLEFRPRWRLSVQRQSLVACLATAGISLLVLSPVLVEKWQALTGRAVEQPAAVEQPPEPVYAHLWDDPNYQASGRYALFTIFPWMGRGGLVDLGPDALHLLILAFLGVLIWLILRRAAWDLPSEVWNVLWASLIMFALSWAGIVLTNSFILYMPSRYTRVGLFLFLLAFVTINAPAAVTSAVRTVQQNRLVLLWLVGGIELAVLVLILLYPSERAVYLGFNIKWLLAPASLLLGVLAALAFLRPPSPRLPPAAASWRIKWAGGVLGGIAVLGGLWAWRTYAAAMIGVSFLDPPPHERAVLQFVETLPADVLLAGTPKTLDNVPLLARRQILFSEEKPSYDAALIRQTLQALYAADFSQVADFCRAGGIDYLVIDLDSYSAEFLSTQLIFFAPYDRQIRAWIGERDTFALADTPAEWRVFQAENWYVLPCAALMSDEVKGGAH